MKKGVLFSVLSSTCFGHQYAHHQEYIAAYDVQHWYCRPRSSGARLLYCTILHHTAVVVTNNCRIVHTASSYAPLYLGRQYQYWTSYAVIYYIVLLMMGILMPETC
jgi:hypothetical protein